MAKTSAKQGSRDRSCIGLKCGAELLRSLDTRTARRARRFLNNDHTGLISLEIDPLSYSSADLFRRDWLAVNLFSKYPELNLGIDTESVAYQKFRDAESQCAVTNQTLKSRFATPSTGVTGDSLLETARFKIAGLLGDFDWNAAYSRMGFSSGASTRLRRAEGDPYYKFQGTPEVTRRAALLAVCAMEASPVWAADVRDRFGPHPHMWVKVVEGSTITTVPKNAKTDRVIAVEPDMNMFLQRGVGGLIRKKLRKVGINLNDQSNNQVLAEEGSRMDTFATIDLSAASDSISYELVKRLMPPDWFEALDLLRCEVGTLPSGERITFEKFSSMGNGYTFELESLLFWGLAQAVMDHYEGEERRVLVYGDDIIVPKAVSGWLIELLAFAGFKTNDDKTFIAGPFRESCGKHYFMGVDVTPIYLRKPIRSLGAKYWLANSIRRWAAARSDMCDPRYHVPWLNAIGTIRPKDRHLIPEGIGDVGLISSFDEARPRLKGSMWHVSVALELKGKPKGIDGIYAYFRELSILREDVPDSLLELASLRGVSPTHSGSSQFAIVEAAMELRRRKVGVGKRNGPMVVVNPNKTRLVQKTMPVSQWLDAPTWVS